MNKKKALLILFLAIAAATVVELYNLTAVALWHDESFSALLVRYDFGEMIARIKLDVHPPLYYVLLKGWDFLFGNSLFALRMFSVFFSVLAIIAVYLFIKKAFKNENLALLSSLLFTFSYFQIQYAMEARMYGLGTFLVVIASYFFLRALEEEKLKWWLFYALALSAGLYTHYFVAFWGAAQGPYLVYYLWKKSGFKLSSWIKERALRLGALSYLLVFLSYIPWLGTFLRQTAQVQETYWIPPIDIWSIPNTFCKMTTGGVIDPNRAGYALLILMAVVAAVVIFFLVKVKNEKKWLIFLMLFLPFLATVLLSFKRSIYIDRYFIFGFPFYLIFIAGAILLIKNKVVRRVLIALVVLGSMTTFPTQWLSLKAEKKPGMAGAAEYLNGEIKPGEKIFVGSSLIYFTFKYYNESNIPPLLYAPDPMPHFSGTALLSPEDIIIDFNAETEKGDAVWMINTTGFGNYQPSLPDNWLKEDENGFEDTYGYRGWIVVTKYLVQ